MDRWVDDLALILYQAGMGSVHLWGTSTGAPLNVRFATRYPDRAKSVITHPGISASPANRQTFKLFQDVAETFGYEALGRLTQRIGCAEHNVFGALANKMALHKREQSESLCVARLAQQPEPLLFYRSGYASKRVGRTGEKHVRTRSGTL